MNHMQRTPFVSLVVPSSPASAGIARLHSYTLYMGLAGRISPI